MKITTLEDLSEHLRSLKLSPGDNVCVHSQLLSFGLIKGGVETVHNAFREVIGEQGTLIVPTYRVAADASDVYDVNQSVSVNVGAFGEYLRKLPGSVRSLCPMHNHTAEGPLAEIMSKPDGHFSMGKGSDFEQLLEHGFKTVYLGCTFPEAATFAFHIQAVFGQIPYRKWLDLQRSVQEGDNAVAFNVKYYGRNSYDLNEDLDVAKNCLQENGKLTEKRCPYSRSYAADLGDFFELVTAELNKDPLFFVEQSQR